MKDKEKANVLENRENENNVAPKKFKAIKIIWLVVMGLITALLVWGLIDVVGVEEGSKKGLAVAAYLIIMVIILGGIGYGACFLIGIVGTIVTAVNLKKGLTTKGTLVWFVLMIIIPALLETTFVLACKLIT